MPVHKVQTTRHGQPATGYKWGQHGHVYTGAGAQQRAAAQGRAAYAAGYTGKKK